MDNHPNYRVAVEAVVKKGNKVLLTRRAENCAVAPGVWNVPAGKLKFHETPLEAVKRECKQEIGQDIKVIKEIGCRVLKTKVKNEEALRLVFTYLSELNEKSDESIVLNDEHSEYKWVDSNEINNQDYDSLMDELKHLITKNVF